VSIRLLFTALAVLTALGATVDAQEDAMVSGHIRAVKVEGTAWQIRSGGQRERLKEGDFLRQGNTVTTADNGRVILLFQNGSTVNLQPGTRFAIDQFLIDPFDAEKVDFRTIRSEPSQSATKIRVDEGTITSKVAKLKRASSYNIATPLGTAGIRGTVVTISANPNASTFVVTEGMIQVTKDGQTFWVAEGAKQGTGGDTRTGRQGSESEQTVVISTDEGYTPPAGEIAALTQQGQQFSQTASQSIPSNAFSGAPQQGTLTPQQTQALEQAAQEGKESLVSAVEQIATETPESAAAAAATAATLMPDAAPDVAAAAAQIVPGSASQIAGAVAGAVPSQATGIAQAVAQVAPSQANSIAQAVTNAAPDADGAAIANAAQQGAQQGQTSNQTGNTGGTGNDGGGAGGGGGSAPPLPGGFGGGGGGGSSGGGSSGGGGIYSN